MVRKTKEEALRTRSQVLDAAEMVFYERGYARTTLEDVARQARVTRGAIYWHFKNKEDLFSAMVERVRMPIESLIEADCDCQNPLQNLREISVHILRETATNARRRRVLTTLIHRCELTDESDDVALRFRSNFVDCTSRIEQVLQRAVEAGQLKAGLDVKRAARAFQAFLNGLMSNWLFFPGAFNLADEADALVEAAIGMLVAGRGLMVATTEPEKV